MNQRSAQHMLQQHAAYNTYAKSQRVLLVLCAFAMFVPTFYRLITTGAWATPEYSHGPIILAVGIWLIWRESRGFSQSASSGGSMYAAWLVLSSAVVLYLLGCIFRMEFLEVLSFLGVAYALVMLIGGSTLLAKLRFPILFMLFMVPLPSVIVSSITNHLKPWVAASAVSLLQVLDYPVGRGGSTIVIGQYRLLVAEACAGMNNLLMLEALGILYLYLVRRTSSLRDGILATLIIPISFAANVLRVIALVLITFYFGEAAGEGYLHKFAGVVTFVIALIAVMTADRLITIVVQSTKSVNGAQPRSA